MVGHGVKKINRNVEHSAEQLFKSCEETANRRAATTELLAKSHKLFQV